VFEIRDLKGGGGREDNWVVFRMLALQGVLFARLSANTSVWRARDCRLQTKERSEAVPFKCYRELRLSALTQQADLAVHLSPF